MFIKLRTFKCFYVLDDIRTHIAHILYKMVHVNIRYEY